MEKEATAPDAPHVPVQEKPHRNGRGWDRLSVVSSVGAGVLGVGTILNNIRHKFYHAFVMGYNESVTAFTPIIEKYTGKGGALESNTGLFSQNGRKHIALEKQFKDGSISEEAYKAGCKDYVATSKKLVKDFRSEVDGKLLRDFHIPTEGFEGWTLGTIKRWKELGVTARKDTAISFATVAAIGFGTLTLLRHNKYTLDRVENKLDDSKSR